MTLSNFSYVIITPANNEQEYIRFTLDSVAAQTHLPTQWVIVDDGSTDDTWNIIQSYAGKYPWIKAVRHSDDTSKRAGGKKVILAFYEGLKALDARDYRFVVKLDADLTLPKDYFEKVAEAFEADPRRGMCGGHLFKPSNGTWKKEPCASYHLRGPIKAYRKECFEQIGGLKPVQNWDGIDEMTAMYLGWTVKILPLDVKHHRVTSTLINHGLRFSLEKGEVYYKDGYDFLLILPRAVTYGLQTKPYFSSAVAFLLGYLRASIKRPPKDVDADVEKFIRTFQYNRIKSFFFRKTVKAG